MRSGSVNAFHTSSRGASNTRVMTNSAVAGLLVWSTGPLLLGGTRRSRTGRSGRLLAIDHPWRAEAVDEHAEPDCPEGLLDRHLHRPALRERLEDALGFRRAVDVEADREALHHALRPVGRGVRGHEHLVADAEPRMHDLVAPFRRHVRLGRRALVGHHHLDLAAEELGVDVERLLAIAVEEQVRVQSHRRLLWLTRSPGSAEPAARPASPCSSREARLRASTS